MNRTSTNTHRIHAAREGGAPTPPHHVHARQARAATTHGPKPLDTFLRTETVLRL